MFAYNRITEGKFSKSSGEMRTLPMLIQCRGSLSILGMSLSLNFRVSPGMRHIKGFWDRDDPGEGHWRLDGLLLRFLHTVYQDEG